MLWRLYRFIELIESESFALQRGQFVTKTRGRPLHHRLKKPSSPSCEERYTCRKWSTTRRGFPRRAANLSPPLQSHVVDLNLWIIQCQGIWNCWTVWFDIVKLVSFRIFSDMCVWGTRSCHLDQQKVALEQNQTSRNPLVFHIKMADTYGCSPEKHGILAVWTMGLYHSPNAIASKCVTTSLQRAQPLRTWRPRKPIRLWGANLDPFYRWKSMTASCKLLHIWLVVEPPLWKIISQLGLYYSQSIEKYKMLRTTNHSLYFLRLSQCPNKRWNLALNICNLHSFIPYLQTLHKPESPQRTLNKQSINPTNPLNQL